MKIDCVIYLVDNYLYLLNIKQNKINIYDLTNCLYDGRIIKPNIFIKKINVILKDNDLSKTLKTINTIIIFESFLKYIDKKNIINSFEQCNCKNIKMINSNTLINKKEIFCVINNHYAIIYKNKRYNKVNFNDFNNINDLIDLLNSKADSKKYICGINTDLEEICSKINSSYYYEDYSVFFLKKIQKRLIKKC